MWLPSCNVKFTPCTYYCFPWMYYLLKTLPLACYLIFRKLHGHAIFLRMEVYVTTFDCFHRIYVHSKHLETLHAFLLTGCMIMYIVLIHSLTTFTVNTAFTGNMRTLTSHDTRRYSLLSKEMLTADSLGTLQSSCDYRYTLFTPCWMHSLLKTLQIVHCSFCTTGFTAYACMRTVCACMSVHVAIL